MIDIIIIMVWVAVALKVSLKIFQWFENRFHIYGQKVQITSPPQQQAQTLGQTQPKEKPLEKQKDTSKKEIRSTKAPKDQTKKQKVIPTTNIEPSQTTKQTQKPQSQILKKQVSQLLINQTDQQISQTEKTFTDPIIEINLPPQSQQTNQALVSEKEQLRKLYGQSQKLRQQQFNEMNQFIQKLKSDKNNYSQKLIATAQDYQAQKQKNKHLSEQIEQLQNSFALKIENLKSNYEAQISQLKQRLIEQQQNISKQQSTTLSIEPAEQVAGLKASLQEMKNQLEFSQSQLQQTYETEIKMKEEIEKLKLQSEARLQQIEKLRAQSLSKLKTRQISISDVINHPEYLRVKEKLQRYETGAMGVSGARSVIQRTQFTPQGQRLSKGLDSRISERRSFISTRHNQSTISGQEEVFAECTFLNTQNKHFLLDEIRKIKKLPIKKTKLLFKLDKLHPTNPHENVDNIPNIVLLVELTNKKILAAFTQTAFNKQDSSIIGDKSLISRSRYGANKSLIIDLSSKVSLPNTRSTETIIYDENAIVWGKDELVIKNDQPTILYSSFGTQEGVYWDGKYTVEELLGGSQGFERISQYEFYRIYIG